MQKAIELIDSEVASAIYQIQGSESAYIWWLNGPKVRRKGDEIPVELYKAVAEVLVFVLRLSGKIR